MSNADPLIQYLAVGQYEGMAYPLTKPPGATAHVLPDWGKGWEVGCQKLVDGINSDADWKITDFHIHDPFGVYDGIVVNPNNGQPEKGWMGFEQFLLASDNGLDFIVKDFVAAWSKRIAAGIKPHFYLGNTWRFDSDKLLPAAYLERAWNAVAPLRAMPAGSFRLYIDASSATQAGTLAEQLFKLLDLAGFELGTEDVPHKGASPLVANRVYTIAEDWRDSILAHSTDPAWTTWAPPFASLKQECVRLLIHPPTGSESWTNADAFANWVRAKARGILLENADGHQYRAAADFNFLRGMGLTRKWVMH